MHAIIIRNYGPAELLEYAEIEKPQVKNNELLVEVHSSSVNPVDWKVREGHLRILTGKRFPKILGADFAGKVVEVGENVHDYKIGNEVYGSIDAIKGGAYAEYISVNPDHISYKPQELSFRQAASIPVAGLTALQSLRDLGNLRNGQKVLINGCSGGVGTFAIQIAKAFGTYVTGVCSDRNIELAKKLGADNVIDYTKSNIQGLKEKFDVIFDVVPNLTFSSIKKILTDHGIYVTTLPSVKTIVESLYTSLISKKKLKIIFVKSNPADLNFLRKLIEEGKLKPHISKVFPLKEAREAHLLSESKRAQGKLVLDVKK